MTRRQATNQDAQRARVTHRRRGRGPAADGVTRSQGGITVAAWLTDRTARLARVERVAHLHTKGPA